MRRALVTGGAGFIGSHLVERLLADGRAVVVLDDFSTGRRENLAAVAADDRLTVVGGSVTDPAAVARAIAGCDRVYHLAAAVGVNLICEQPVRTLEVNIRGTEVVLAAAADSGARVFLASSSEVYGKSASVPFHEDDDLVIGSSRFPRWGYACAKAADEFLAMAWARRRGLEVVVGRLFNTIGPRQVGRYGMVVPRFVDAALRGEPLPVYGTGEQTRTFIHVADTVEAIVSLTAESAELPAIVNIGSDAEIAIEALADRVIALSGSASGKRHLPYDEAYGAPIEDMARRRPSIGRARELLGSDWPRRGLDETLREIIDARRRELDRPKG